MGRNSYLSVVSTVVRRLDLRLCRVWDQACNAAEVDMSTARVEVIDDYYDPFPLYSMEGPYFGIFYANLRSGVHSLGEKTHRDLVKAVRAKVKRDVKRQMQMPKFSNSLVKVIQRSPWKRGLTPSNVFSKSTPGAREFKEQMACWAEQDLFRCASDIDRTREVMLRFEARMVEELEELEELEDDLLCSKLLQERPGEMDFSANSCYEPDVYNQLVEWIEGAKEYHREIEIKDYTGWEPDCCVNLFRFEVAHIEQLLRDYKAQEGAAQEIVARRPSEAMTNLHLRNVPIPAADHGSMELEPEALQRCPVKWDLANAQSLFQAIIQDPNHRGRLWGSKDVVLWNPPAHLESSISHAKRLSTAHDTVRICSPYKRIIEEKHRGTGIAEFGMDAYQPFVSTKEEARRCPGYIQEEEKEAIFGPANASLLGFSSLQNRQHGKVLKSE
ncbi:hypothetical protein SELMODRAFT_406924 [Selaginella moellendorffii]|uniref:Uncharacterized protein n=1 Tax=Selaginella moellendorffii TaxID=88036 RepID=D8R3D1_SELML|nr:hypothetical protein SELMODRAFT_406924 [Selaginella moellendorffii]